MDLKASGLRKGTWSKEEDELLRNCIDKYGEGKWSSVPERAGLKRCRKSCRLRWLNYLSPKITRGKFSGDEIDLLIRLHKLLGNRWSLIAGRIPGRTANDIKNYWNSHLSKRHKATKFRSKTIDAEVARPNPERVSANWSWPTNIGTNYGNNLDAEETEMPKLRTSQENQGERPNDLIMENGWEELMLHTSDVSLQNFQIDFKTQEMEELTEEPVSLGDEGNDWTAMENYFFDELIS